MLVVGPSGAGKDTVLAGAQARLAGDPHFRFVRRVITRPAEAGGEDHEPVSEAEFAERRLALQWQAHGLRYGIPADIGQDLAAGRIVVANVSRSVLAEAAARFRTRVIEVTAPGPVLAARLAERGRETPDDIARRLSRTVTLPPGMEVCRVVNDGPVEQGVDRFLLALTG